MRNVRPVGLLTTKPEKLFVLAPVVPGARRLPPATVGSRTWVVTLGVSACRNLETWNRLYSSLITGDMEHSCRTVPTKEVRSVRGVSNLRKETRDQRTLTRYKPSSDVWLIPLLPVALSPTPSASTTFPVPILVKQPRRNGWLALFHSSSIQLA